MSYQWLFLSADFRGQISDIYVRIYIYNLHIDKDF